MRDRRTRGDETRQLLQLWLRIGLRTGGSVTALPPAPRTLDTLNPTASTFLSPTIRPSAWLLIPTGTTGTFLRHHTLNATRVCVQRWKPDCCLYQNVLQHRHWGDLGNNNDTDLAFVQTSCQRIGSEAHILTEAVTAAGVSESNGGGPTGGYKQRNIDSLYCCAGCLPLRNQM